jgi:phosphatidate cytidylyltransferase
MAAVFAGGWPFAAAAGLVALLASFEFIHGWLFPTQPIRTALTMAPGALAAATMVAGAQAGGGYVLLGLALAALLAALGYGPTRRFGPRKPYRVLSWCLTYVGGLFSTIVLIRGMEGGRDWVLLGLLATFAVDTGAYAVGRAIGRHKLAPKISPGKTREGSAGGYVAGVAAVFALNAAFDTGVDAATIAPFALVMPVAAEAGDLFESWMKRRMGVKDASGLLPGHGGFLDRMDSIVFVMPLLYAFLRLRVL